MNKKLLCNIWDVEFGSAAHIYTPNYQHILLDAGKNENGFSPSNHLKNEYFINEIDLFVLSHPHNDHLQDLPSLVNTFTILKICRNKNTPKWLVDYSASPGLRVWKDLDNTYIHTCAPIDYGFIFKTYGAKENQLSSGSEKLNNYSLLTTCTYNNTMLIFPGDLEPDGWDAIFDNTPFENEIDASYKILIAPHHGRASGVRRNGNPYTRFLKAIKPDLTIISDKYGSEYTEETLYTQYSLGLNIKTAKGYIENRKTVSTKTINCITIEINDCTSIPSVTLS